MGAQGAQDFYKLKRLNNLNFGLKNFKNLNFFEINCFKTA